MENICFQILIPALPSIFVCHTPRRFPPSLVVKADDACYFGSTAAAGGQTTLVFASCTSPTSMPAMLAPAAAKGVFIVPPPPPAAFPPPPATCTPSALDFNQVRDTNALRQRGHNTTVPLRISGIPRAPWRWFKDTII